MKTTKPRPIPARKVRAEDRPFHRGNFVEIVGTQFAGRVGCVLGISRQADYPYVVAIMGTPSERMNITANVAEENLKQHRGLASTRRRARVTP